MLPLWALWLIACGVFLIVEIFTVSFFMFWPGIGAFLAFIAAVLGASFPVQVGVFAISTIILIIFMKPIITKLFKTNDVPMNSTSLIGKVGVVIKEIDNSASTGQVKVAGELWSAFSDNESIIPNGISVTITGIEGVKLKVKQNN